MRSGGYHRISLRKDDHLFDPDVIILPGIPEVHLLLLAEISLEGILLFPKELDRKSAGQDEAPILPWVLPHFDLLRNGRQCQIIIIHCFSLVRIIGLAVLTNHMIGSVYLQDPVCHRRLYCIRVQTADEHASDCLHISIPMVDTNNIIFHFSCPFLITISNI